MVRIQAPRLQDSRILVVGGAGFIGRHIVRALCADGAEVTILDMAPPPPEFDKLDRIVGSIVDTTLFASAVSGCDAVVFLANSSLPGSANTNLTSEVESHVKTSVQCAEICNAQGVKRFVFASSGGTVYGYSSDLPLHEDMVTRPRNAYGVSKLAIEHYLRIIGMQRDLETVSLRVSNPYGEGQRALRNQGFIAAAMQHAVNGKVLPIWGDGHVERDFVHASDVAQAFVAACCVKDVPEICNIGSGEAVSLLKILDQIEPLLGRKLEVEFEPSRTVDVTRNVLDISRARDQLGWSPQISLAEGMQRTADWWSAQS